MRRLLLASALLTVSPVLHATESDVVNQTAPNALLAPWTGPFGGVPAFEGVTAASFEPAFEAAIAEYLANVEAIAGNPERPSFENTIEALEDAARTLGRVRTVYGIHTSTLSTPALREVEARLAPKLAALRDRVAQDAALFARVDAVYRSPKARKLDAEQRRLLEETHRWFVREGARLDGPAKARLAAIHQELAALYTTFGQNLLADEETFVVVDDEARLAGLSPSLRAAMAAAAAERGLEGRWVVVNTRSIAEPVLTHADDRGLREEVWRAWTRRGDNGDEHDNNAIVTRILALRAERAKLLGHPTHAHWATEDTMAGSPERAMALLEAVWAPAVARLREEIALAQEAADVAGAGYAIAPWDLRYWLEKVRRERYDLDPAELAPYLQLENLREGMFWMAGQLYGLRFRPAPEVPVYHPDVRVWEVQDASGRHVGLWFFDPFARPGKRSGAWMNAYRKQERFRGDVTPIVSNNANFVKAAPGEPVLISWDDARTLFHEFGHALHGLLSNVRYPSLSGTSVPRDYVEFPSQLHEHWLDTPELLQRFARHVETGEPMPEALVARLHEARTFGQGFATVEYLASAIVDMKLHLLGATPVDPDAFERDTLAALGMPAEIVMRHRVPHFSHVFAGSGYAAGYYAYLWADALTADAAEAFREAGSMYDADTAARLVAHVLSVGHTVRPADGWRAFRGRDVDTRALLRDRGFPVD